MHGEKKAGIARKWSTLAGGPLWHQYLCAHCDRARPPACSAPLQFIYDCTSLFARLFLGHMAGSTAFVDASLVKPSSSRPSSSSSSSSFSADFTTENDITIADALRPEAERVKTFGDDDQWIIKNYKREIPLPPITLSNLISNINYDLAPGLLILHIFAIIGWRTIALERVTCIWAVLYYFITGLGITAGTSCQFDLLRLPLFESCALQASTDCGHTGPIQLLMLCSTSSPSLAREPCKVR
jgi:hypothetical protein